MATATEIAEIFTSMASRFKPEKAEGVDAVIQFDLTGDNGGLYWIKINSGTVATGQGQSSETPKITLKAAADDWHSIAHGKLNAMQAFMGGKLKIQGDTTFALKMQSMFGM